MRINSYVLPGSLGAEMTILPPDESHHLARVLRVAPGQELTLFDGQGTQADAVVETVSKNAVSVRILDRRTIDPDPVGITLIQAVCKPDRLEMILQKATELGVSSIHPVRTQNCSLPAGKISKMAGRGQTIIRNAAQQCGTAWLPEFHPLEDLASVLPQLNSFDAVFIGSLHPDTKPFRESLQKAKQNHIKTAALLIGPEGDFAREEVSACVAAGAIPVSFGNQILRTETAALFGLSVLRYELS
jgi:16S rRNA (uracil1498-N3)-methyltransferase